MALIHAQASPPPQLVLQNEHPLKGKPVPSSAAVYDLCPLVAFKKAQRVDQLACFCCCFYHNIKAIDAISVRVHLFPTRRAGSSTGSEKRDYRSVKLRLSVSSRQQSLE